jgi:hypothetical protein
MSQLHQRSAHLTTDQTTPGGSAWRRLGANGCFVILPFCNFNQKKLYSHLPEVVKTPAAGAAGGDHGRRRRRPAEF